MRTDLWNGNGDWNLNPADWSLGAPPTSSEGAEIQSGNSTISTSAPHAAEWLTIDSGAGLSLDNGVRLTLTDWLNNAGTWTLGGGDTVTMGGRLTNSGDISIGGAGITASTKVTAASLTNTSAGTLVLQGNAGKGTTDQATLDVTGASSATVAGTLEIFGDADLELTTGITSIGTGATLELDGSEAKVLIGGVSALSSLTTNNGTLSLQGGTSNGAGGVTLTRTTRLTNNGTFDIDTDPGAGGSAVTLGGGLTGGALAGGVLERGYLNIGNATLSASTTVSTTSLGNNFATIQGAAASGATSKATLDISGAAPSTWTGGVIVRGAATLQFASGGITSIGLDGSEAGVLTSGGASALSALTTNDGGLFLVGDTSSGAGGATLTTTKSFTNYDWVLVDSQFSPGSGGSAVSFGGALTNDGLLAIGNASLAASTTVKATTLNNGGLSSPSSLGAGLYLQGNSASGTTDNASLILSGAAPSTLAGTVQIAGDAKLQFGSGGIATIGWDGSLEMAGAGAKVLTSGGASNGLSGLTENDGTLQLVGDDSSLGAGGATLTTTKSFTNYGLAEVDSTVTGDGASAATFGGTLNNDGTLDIGSSSITAATTVTTKALSNAGAISLAGSSGFLAELVVNGAGSTTGNITIGAGAEIDVTGSHSFTQNGGSTTVTGSLVASTIDADDGLLDFASAITSGDGVGALNIGDLGNLEFGAAVDSSHTVSFSASDGTLSLGDARAFSGAIDNFAASDAIDLLSQPITSLAYSGSSTSGILTVTGSSGTIATLAFNGDYKTTSFTFASDGHGGSDILHT